MKFLEKVKQKKLLSNTEQKF